MQIGILQTGHAPDALIEKAGDYPAMFARLLDGRGLTFRTWAVVDGDRMRMLQPSELRRAMGFPETTQLPADRRTAIKLLGNAVCPPVAREIAAAILSPGRVSGARRAA